MPAAEAEFTWAPLGGPSMHGFRCPAEQFSRLAPNASALRRGARSQIRKRSGAANAAGLTRRATSRRRARTDTAVYVADLPSDARGSYYFFLGCREPVLGSDMPMNTHPIPGALAHK